MEKNVMAIIGVVAVIVIVAIVALALSGTGGKPGTTVTTSVGVSSTSYTTAITTVANSIANNTTGTSNSLASNSTNTTKVSGTTNRSNSTAKKYDIMVGSSPSIGNYLENSEGFTLYLLNSDTQYRNSTCTGTCATFWPPYVFNGSLNSLGLPIGVNMSAFGIITRLGGSRQLTYDGWPLYLFSGDSAPGQVNGNGIHAYGGTWYAVTVPKATTS